MCFKSPTMPTVEKVDVEKQQRDAEVKASQSSQRSAAERRKRQRRSTSISQGAGNALTLYGGGAKALGGQ